MKIQLGKYRPGRVSLALTLLGSLVLAATAGCGGMGQDDMRAYAMQRAPDPEDEEESAPSPAANPAPAAEASVAPAAEAPATVTAATTQATEPRVADASPPATTASESDEPVATSPGAPPATAKQPLPQTPEDRARWAAENLERVATALEAYREEKGLYPPVAIRDPSRAPLLSWRVELLPYLGYNDLYQQFDKTQPWYAPTNKALLKQIPREYQSPERGDEKTNLLVPFGGSTVFQQVRTLHVNRIEDGLANTVVLLEVDDDRAVNWTQPSEYELNTQQPKAGLGNLRAGQVFVVWGGGTVGSVSMQSPDEGFKAMFSADGGEHYTMASMNRPIDFSSVATATPATPLATQQPAAAALQASSRSNTNAASSRPAAESTALASTYRSAAAAALAEGEATSAWQWYYASLAMGASPPPEFEWYPALRRPALGLHLGVAVAADSEANLRQVRRGDGDQVTRSSIVQATKPYGDSLLRVIEKHAAEVALRAKTGLDSGSGRRGKGNQRSFDSSAGITSFLPGSETQVRRDAMQAGCDVLILFVVEENARRTNRSLRVKLLDLASRREIYTSRRLNYTPLQADRDGPGDSDELQQVEWEMEDLLEDGLSPKSWPVSLNSRIARKRVASLGESRDPFPPRVIAEILYYRSRNLVDSAEVLDALETLLGDDAGSDLLLGSETKRRRVIREWLPEEDAEELIALADRRQREDDDD